jgi:NAD(P)-dependent dehydrogenase (short-subunit alcohol dehydrogenase family)
MRGTVQRDEATMSSLRGKVALVTGGSSGIGRAAALRLAQQGARVAVAARTVVALETVATEIRAAGGEALAVALNVTDEGQCRSAVETVVTHFGRLDLLLCCAGISMRAEFAASDLAALEQVWRVNFLGTLYPTYHAISPIKQTRGSLVAVSSVTGKRGVPTYAMYGASKSAVQGLYESLRVELASFGVHVGIFSPAFVDTPLRERVLGADGKPSTAAPASNFRLWSVERCVDSLMNLIVRRKRQATLPWFVGPLLALDDLTNGWAGDRYLGRKFYRTH